MGIKNGSMLLYHVGGISMNNLITILQHQASHCCEKASPAVAFDVNWLAQRFGQYKVGPVPSIFQFAEAFLCQGVDVHVLTDGLTDITQRRSVLLWWAR